MERVEDTRDRFCIGCPKTQTCLATEEMGAVPVVQTETRQKGLSWFLREAVYSCQIPDTLTVSIFFKDLCLHTYTVDRHWGAFE